VRAPDRAAARLRHPRSRWSQHIPATFARALTERLTQVARAHVQEVTAEVPLRRGAIMMATGDAHLG
jgi:chemotaxis response regulator CheB